jgi:hypothetical protein
MTKSWRGDEKCCVDCGTKGAAENAILKSEEAEEEDRDDEEEVMTVAAVAFWRWFCAQRGRRWARCMSPQSPLPCCARTWTES